MKNKFLTFLIFLLILLMASMYELQAEPIYNYGSYSVNDNVTISACFSVNTDMLYANIIKPDNLNVITTLFCGGTNYCQPSWTYCTGIFTNTNVFGIYNVSFFSDRYSLSSSFKGFFTVFEGTFLNVTSPLNNSLTNNKTATIKGLTNGTNVTINVKGNNFSVNVINGIFTFPFDLTEGENVIKVKAYGIYRYQNSTTLKIILDTIPPQIRWINYTDSIKLYQTFKFVLNITDNVNLTYVSASAVFGDTTENLFVYFVDGLCGVAVKPIVIGSYILNVKACDSMGNCNESSYRYYVYAEHEEKPKDKENLPLSNVTPPLNITNENKTENKNETSKEYVVIYTHGNLTTKINASEEDKISGTIYATPEEKGIKFEANGSTLKNFEFYVNGSMLKTDENGYITNEKSKEVFWDSLKESYEKSLRRFEKVIGIVPENLEMLKENGIFEIVVEVKGNVVKNDEVEVILPNGEKIKVRTDEKGKVRLVMNDGKIESLKKGVVKIPKKIEEGKVYKMEVRDKDRNLIKNGITEITLPDGEKIIVKTDKDGTVKLANHKGKIMLVKTEVKIPENLEEGKVYEVEVRDENGNLVKNKKVSIELNGKPFEIETDENGKIKVKFENGEFGIVKKEGVKNETKEFEFHWQYLLFLLLIPLVLFFILKENIILTYGFCKKLEKENNFNELKKYGKIYVLERYKNDVKIKAIFVNEESEEKLAERLKLKILR